MRLPGSDQQGSRISPGPERRHGVEDAQHLGESPGRRGCQEQVSDGLPSCGPAVPPHSKCERSRVQTRSSPSRHDKGVSWTPSAPGQTGLTSRPGMFLKKARRGAGDQRAAATPCTPGGSSLPADVTGPHGGQPTHKRKSSQLGTLGIRDVRSGEDLVLAQRWPLPSCCVLTPEKEVISLYKVTVPSQGKGPTN